ncbi:MAG TPA: NAD-dependent epimerase/dehydratase family protein [Caldimonas sp.]|nr:NAD-dependent epimerase/dehydratase family protein [Caldimonas sp.]
MRTLVTGAGGFIGRGLVERLVADLVAKPNAATLCLTDLDLSGAGDGSTTGDPRIVGIEGDIVDAPLQARLFAEPIDAVFHLAGVVSGAAERDFGLGKRVNLDATIALLEHCRQQAERGGPLVRFTYASSIAVFGAPLPGRIDDATPAVPGLSYGAHKRACEVLIDDYTRRGFIDGRALRLPGVVVRPRTPNGALSAFNSDLIREPLAGRDYVCPVGRDATLWVVSRWRAVDALRRLAAIDGEALGRVRAVNMPALRVEVGAIVEALARAKPGSETHVRFEPQVALEAQFARWPLAASFDRGQTLGLCADTSLDEVITRHLKDDRP